jgi:hypothetical protein
VPKWLPQGLRINDAIFTADFRLAPLVGVSDVYEDVDTALRSCVFSMA